MKYHISPKQAKQVSKEMFYACFEELVDRDDWANYHHKKMDIGKMMELLDEITVGRSMVDQNWHVSVFEDQFEEKELVDALWEAVKVRIFV